MKRLLLTLALALSLCANLFAAYPYDSVCDIRVGKYGGSASLIAVSEDKALLLTAQHVVLRRGNPVGIKWLSGETSTGVVLRIGPEGFDIAVVICPRPKDLRPIPIAMPSFVATGRITNVGYPGTSNKLEWQTGKLLGISTDSVQTSCRPIPGMSGGATLDQYGNLIGVITRYGPRSGESSSGVELVNFVARFMRTQTASTWSSPAMSFLDPVQTGPTESEILAPEDWGLFLLHIQLFYNVEPEHSAAVKEHTQALSVPAPTVKAHKIRTRFRRRLFRRRF